nr:hypothetical protein [Trentepohlia sp. YN1317]
MRVGSLLHINYNHLRHRFAVRTKLPIQVLVEKKRNKADTQSFILHEQVWDEFFKGHELKVDFEYVENQFKNYVAKNNYDLTQIADLPLYFSFNEKKTTISRSYLRDTVNKLLKMAAKNIDPYDNLLYSSHGFGVNMATRLIQNYGIRIAQQYLRHTNITTTVIYDRNQVSIEKLQEISRCLADATYGQNKSIYSKINKRS